MERAYTRVSACRILALAVAVGGHCVVLVALLMPATPANVQGAISQMHDAQIKVRWVSSRSPVATQRAATASVANATIRGARPRSPRANRPDVANAAPSDIAAEPPSRIMLPNTLALPGQRSASSGTVADAGFQDRVHDAQHSRDVRGIPGSDRRIVRGIALTDPRKQGLGSLLRNVQRLFGITQHACMDVDAMRQLTTEELAARHLTQEDLDRQADKYQCNEPLGQHF
jgi:hypothetical protein